MTIAGLDCVSNGPDDFIIVSLLFVVWKNAIDREKKKECRRHVNNTVPPANTR
jgi:hypothetical protein